MNDREELKEQTPDVTQEERELASDGNTQGGRTWNNWEGDPEYVKAQQAAAELEGDRAPTETQVVANDPEALDTAKEEQAAQRKEARQAQRQTKRQAQQQEKQSDSKKK